MLVNQIIIKIQPVKCFFYFSVTTSMGDALCFNVLGEYLFVFYSMHK